MNESEAVEYLTNLKSGSICPGLDRVEELLKRLGNPQDELKYIHIAGTNGKGSTLAFVSEILKEAGFRTGRFSSPAIFTYRETIQINDKSISVSFLVKLVEQIKVEIDKMVSEGLDSPSAFEAQTALALLYFKEKKCDYVVMECGMGGLMDSTNIISSPEVAVLASISYDHMAFLGDSLEKIASQKAGIIKPGCIVVSAKQHDEAERIIIAKAKECDCKLRIVDETMLKDIDKPGIRKLRNERIMQRISYKGYKKIEVSLLGKYQKKNAALALEVVEALKERGVKISDEAVYSGFSKVVWPGRFQIVNDKPLIVLDGAHNEEAAIRLAETLDFYFTNTRIVYIMGMLKDKEYEKVCEITAPKADCIFTVSTPNNPRALGATELAETVRRYKQNVTSADSLEEALEMASLVAEKDGVIVVFGSLSFLGKMTELIKNGSGKDKECCKTSIRRNR